MAAVDAARAGALRLLEACEEKGAPPLLDALDAHLPAERDRRFARQLALGVLCWRRRLDWMLDHYSRRPVARLDQRVRNILRLGAYQLAFLDRVPARAAVHTSVELAKRRGAGRAAGLVNAVLRALQRQPQRVAYPDPEREPARYLSLFHSHPQWLVERWMARWGTEATRALLEANNRPAGLWIRLHALRADADALRAELELEEGPVSGYYRALDPAAALRSRAWAEGLFQVQDPAAGLAVALLDPQPGERVLETCSAPGGKATQMAEHMGDCGLIVAGDASPARLRRVRENARRLRLLSLRFAACDGRAPATGDCFDRVLVDAPCSGTGIFGRHPDARWRKEPGQLPGLAARQAVLLDAAFARLRPGGVLVYSTCSLEREENEEIVEDFLARTPAAQLEEARRFFAAEWAGRYVQTLPGRHFGDGAFAARLRKRIP